MNKYAKWFVIGLGLLCIGCTRVSVKSLNIQKVVCRSIADSGTTVIFETLDADKVMVVKNKTEEIAKEIMEFLDKGDVPLLTVTSLTVELRKKIPSDYSFVLDLLVSQISGIKVDIDSIGVNNVKRLKAACLGIIWACANYSMEDRPKTTESTIDDTDVTEIDIKVFGDCLTKEVNNKV